jgi:hypothetical protein
VTEPLSARVFICCAQGTTAEVEAARELGRILREEHGYEVYIARDQVSLEGVKEAIFPQLREAEYLLFIDFPRERLSETECRGSLFSHQELAIAALLDTPYIGFRHRSVRREGLSGFLLSNVAEFASEIELPKLLRAELAARGDWRPQWRKELRVSRPDPGEGDDMVTGPAREPVRYFHLTVENLHRDKMAVGCTAYVESISDAQTREPVDFRPAELKWAGTTLPSVPIVAGRSRDLDACRIFEADPRTVRFVSLSDSGKHMAPVSGRPIDVTYVVLSENFAPSRCTLRVEPGDTPQTARVGPMP